MRMGSSNLSNTHTHTHTYHNDSIIEQALSKNDNIELLIDTDVLKDVEHSHWVHGRDYRGKQQVLLQVDVLHTKRLNLADGIQRQANAHGVPQRAHHCVPHHCARVLKEGSSGHEVPILQHDGWQHVQEEDIRLQHGRRFLLH